MFIFFFSSRRRHTSSLRDWSSDVCSSDLVDGNALTWAKPLRPPEKESIPGGRRGLAHVSALPSTRDKSHVGMLFKIAARSEERRVGKECRSRGSRDQQKKYRA